MRSISQIYSEAIVVRNNYLQLTELNTGRSNSKMSILNLLTYVVAVCIHTYEMILDRFTVDIVTVVDQRMCGTAEYYLRKAKLFQFNPSTSVGDTLIFNDNTFQAAYEKEDPTHRIIEKAAYEYDNTALSDITLKVAKKADTSGEQGIYGPLTSEELTAFKDYIDKIKFVGTKITCVSLPADILHLIGTIYYDEAYLTREQAYDAVKAALAQYAEGFDYNDYIYYQKIIDTIQAIGHVDISSEVEILVQQYSRVTSKYDTTQNLTSRLKPASGYVSFVGTDGESTINLTNITFTPMSNLK